jgi:uncharacterized protein
VEVRHNEKDNRFEIEIDGKVAATWYRRHRDKIIFTHTEVPPELEGHGVGGALARAALTHARKEGLRVVPLCPFIAAFIKRHKEYQDLAEVAPR